MRTLHPAFRVTDLDASLVFYTALGYGQVGQVDLGGGAGLTMLKLPSDDFVALELVHRPADGPVDIGTGFSHLAVQIDNLTATAEGVNARGMEAWSNRASWRTGRGSNLMAQRPRRLSDRVGRVAAGASRWHDRGRLPSVRRPIDREDNARRGVVERARPTGYFE